MNAHFSTLIYSIHIEVQEQYQVRYLVENRANHTLTFVNSSLQQATTKSDQPFFLSKSQQATASNNKHNSSLQAWLWSITLPSKSKSSHIKIKIKIKLKKHGFRSVLISNCQYSRPPLDTARNTSTDARQRRLFVSSVL